MLPFLDANGHEPFGDPVAEGIEFPVTEAQTPVGIDEGIVAGKAPGGILKQGAHGEMQQIRHGQNSFKARGQTLVQFRETLIQGSYLTVFKMVFLNITGPGQ
jgi:hypothetical protein